MENYIVINGKRAELTKEQLEKLGIKPEDPEEKYPAKFKVGDRVRVSCSTKTLGRNEEYEGMVFTVKSVFKLSEYRYGPGENIRAYGLGTTYVVYENELELFSYEKIFEALDCGEPYFFINDEGNLVRELGGSPGEWQEFTNARYACGNVCKDKGIMIQRALHEILNRLLWRASIKAGELANPWDGRHPHYFIYYNHDLGYFKIDYNKVSQHQEISYFPTEESAKDAVENIVKPFMKEHPDFVL